MNVILDWTEVWAVLIPLFAVVLGGKQPKVNRPIVLYLICAFVINLFCDLIWKFDLITYNGVSTNGFLYNIHSIIRFVLFDLYFIRLGYHKGAAFGWGTRFSFGLFVLINFVFFERFYDPHTPFSSLLLSVESVLLLVLCLQYYFYKFGSEEQKKLTQPDFWMVTGLSIYVVVNFFIFLLYDTLSRKSVVFAVQLWNVHNISYVVFNLFIAKALYESQHG